MYIILLDMTVAYNRDMLKVLAAVRLKERSQKVVQKDSKVLDLHRFQTTLLGYKIVEGSLESGTRSVCCLIGREPSENVGTSPMKR